MIQSIRNYLPYALIGICVTQVVINWGNPDVAIAWIAASLGWLAYKLEV